jgi:site-specific DNA recombinase
MIDYTAIYLRVSTEEQVREGVSLAMQRDLCERYVDLHDLPRDTIVFTDEGKSAATLDRPGLDKLRGQLGGIVKHVVVFKLDRLTRKVGDLCTLLTECEKEGVALHGVRDKLDTSTASGRLVLHIMGAVAEWERDTIADRTRSGLAHIQSQGFHIGNPPYGWDAVSHDGPGQLLMPNNDYPHIADSREAHALGMSLAGIASIVKGQRHPQAGKRIISAPLVEEMHAVVDQIGDVIGYRHPT